MVQKWLPLLLVAGLHAGIGLAVDVRFYYTSNRQGEIEPCGCPVNQNGGIGRMAAFLIGEKRDPARSFFGDAGDTFFSLPVLPPTRLAEEARRARVIAEAYRKLSLDAFTPGERDFAEGIESLRELQSVSGAAFVSTNIVGTDGKNLFAPSLMLKKDGVKVGVLGVADPDAFSGVKGVLVIPPAPAVAAGAKALRQSGADVVVLLSHLGLSADKELAKTGGLDLIIGSHSLDALAQPERVGDTWIVQPLYQGQQIGRLTFDSKPHRWRDARLIDLTKDWEDHPNEIFRLVVAYRETNRRIALSSDVPAGDLSSDKSQASLAFAAHPGKCRSCHRKQYDFWETTKHASAYLVLYAKNQHFDPECIGCHSLGFQEPGGFKSITAPIRLVGTAKRQRGEIPLIERLMAGVFAEDGPRRPLDSRVEPERFANLKQRYDDEIHKLDAAGKIEHLYAGVQCEHCHGNLNGHPGSRVHPKKIVEATCRGCHRPPRAPDFNFAMVKLVTCPH